MSQEKEAGGGVGLDKYLPFADQPTPKSQVGTWCLVAPDGREFTGESPLHCIRAESSTRIPPHVALGRIARSLRVEDAAQDPPPEFWALKDAVETLSNFAANGSRSRGVIGTAIGAELTIVLAALKAKEQP
jgi:hypothetical protein